MLVQVTRTASALTARVLFYGALFLFVVVAHLALTTVLRQQGWTAAAAVTASGGGVLAAVLVLVNAADWVRERRIKWREAQRLRHRLPVGPCCVVWRETAGGDQVMPWKTVGPVRARFPSLARRLGVEGLAVVEFEVGADGRAKNFACVDAWPSDMFYTAAREALMHARFQPKFDEHMRFGASYRMPFIFRIAGASRVSERGQRARRLRPGLQAVRQMVQKLGLRRGSA